MGVPGNPPILDFEKKKGEQRDDLLNPDTDPIQQVMVYNEHFTKSLHLTSMYY